MGIHHVAMAIVICFMMDINVFIFTATLHGRNEYRGNEVRRKPGPAAPHPLEPFAAPPFADS